MASVEHIQSEIESLPRREYVRLLRWMQNKDWEDWDKQLSEDALSGKLDFLIDEALDEKTKGKLKDF